MHYVVECCSVLQCVAVCCIVILSVLQGRIRSLQAAASATSKNAACAVATSKHQQLRYNFQNTPHGARLCLCV